MKHADQLTNWLGDLFRSIDERDAVSFVKFLTPDATFRFGSAPPTRGRSAIQDVVEAFFSTIAGCRHDLSRTWHDDDTVVCEGKVTYTRHDGSEITLPFANVFVLCDGLVDRYSIYTDVNPLYQHG